MALASSVTVIAAALQRLEQHADAKHLRRLRLPHVGARSACWRLARRAHRDLQRVGDRHAPAGRRRRRRSQAAIRASILVGVHQAACRVVHQHPVVRPAPSLAQRLQAVAHRGRARRRHRTRSRRLAAAGKRGSTIATSGSSGKTTSAMPSNSPLSAREGLQRVFDHRATRRSAGIAWVPSHRRGCRCRRKESGRKIGKSDMGATAACDKGAAILESAFAPRPRQSGAGVFCIYPRHFMRLSLNSRPASASRCRAHRGSADALLLARNLARTRTNRPAARPPCSRAEPTDAQRLIDEIAFFAPDAALRLFPDWETLPYDSFSPHQDLISERLATLWRSASEEADVVLVPATTALYRLAPPAFLAAYTFQFKQRPEARRGEAEGPADARRLQPREPGRAPGEYAVRGGLIDLFPMGSPVPYRVDLFDDEIDSIRTFDPDTQRSLYPVPEVRLLPGREFPMDEAARTRFPQPLARAARRRSRPSADLQGHGQRRRRRRASSTTCRSSSTRPRRCSTTSARSAHGRAARRHGRRAVQRFWQRHRRALPLPAARPRAAAAAAAKRCS